LNSHNVVCCGTMTFSGMELGIQTVCEPIPLQRECSVDAIHPRVKS
jgi:hypothetical protein